MKDYTLYDALQNKLVSMLGAERAQAVGEDIADVLAKHKLVTSPDICEVLFSYMIEVSKAWNSV